MESCLWLTNMQNRQLKKFHYLGWDSGHFVLFVTVISAECIFWHKKSLHEGNRVKDSNILQKVTWQLQFCFWCLFRGGSRHLQVYFMDCGIGGRKLEVCTQPELTVMKMYVIYTKPEPCTFLDMGSIISRSIRWPHEDEGLQEVNGEKSC